MSEPDPEAWTETMTALERVRAVVELLDEPASIEEISERADVSRNTAEEELDLLVVGSVVDLVTVDGTERYWVDPVRLFFEEIQPRFETSCSL